MTKNRLQHFHDLALTFDLSGATQEPLRNIGTLLEEVNGAI